MNAHPVKGSRANLQANPLARDLLAKLESHKVLSSLSERRMYRFDAIQIGETPLVVVLAETVQDVVEVVKLARKAGVPLVARGAASGLSGGAAPSREGIVLSFTRMNRLEIRPQRREAWVQAGVVTGTVNEKARPHGLIYPPDPASWRTSTMGGNVAENAGGPMCFKYGVTGDYVKSLEVVDSDGNVHLLERDSFDLAGLIIGSEGTLGLVTSLTLRLVRPAPFTRTLRAYFPSVGQAAQAVSQAISSGAVPSKLEFMDGSCIRAVEDYLKLGLPQDAGAMLLIDTDGHSFETVEEELELAETACLENGGAVQRARGQAESDALWQARRSVSPALGRIRPQRMNEDIVVPRSHLPEVVREIETLGLEAGLKLVQFGHIGDGNLHPNILFDPKLESEERVHALAFDIARVALRHGGVLSGEHGIGSMKRPFMLEALDRSTLETLWRIKNALDPGGMLNPDKLLPDLSEKSGLEGQPGGSHGSS